MPKKNSTWGENSKSVQARERKAAQKNEEQTKKKKATDDAFWKDDNKLDSRKKERKVGKQFFIFSMYNKNLESILYHKDPKGLFFYKKSHEKIM